MQTDALCSVANNTQHCWVQHVASVCMEPQQCRHLLALTVAYSLKPVKLLGPCKRTQHWRHERSSRLISNLSNCEREAWKKFRLQRDSNPWPLRYRCSALPTELWSHNCWEQVNFSGSIMPLRIIQHYSDWVCTAVMSKWRHERSSRLIRNLSNCEREAWKKFRLQQDSNPWPLRYRCSVLPTELWSHNCWEQVNFSGSIMPLRIIQHYSDWVCTAVMSKWRYERSSRLIRNLSNCEREAWKKFRLQRDSNPWPLRYRCSALPTELWSHNCWEQVNFSGRNIVGPNMPSRSILVDATLLGLTRCVRLHAWNHNNVCTCCVQFETSQTFGATSPNISFLWLAKPVCMGSQQCWPRENVCAFSSFWIVVNMVYQVDFCAKKIWGNIRRLCKKSKNARKCTKRWSDHEVEQLIDLVEKSCLWDV